CVRSENFPILDLREGSPSFLNLGERSEQEVDCFAAADLSNSR
ncbi:MAG: hypothetical protein JWN70_1643, partial [Planctomycetaceae bacterium]|nr:hypothetical protein [Planctomycetaceae bacterium]